MQVFFVTMSASAPNAGDLKFDKVADGCDNLISLASVALISGATSALPTSLEVFLVSKFASISLEF